MQILQVISSCEFHLLSLFQLITVKAVEEKSEKEVEHHEVANLDLEWKWEWKSENEGGKWNMKIER